MAVKYRDLCDLVFMDDKHKCKVGEPNAPVAAVERGKAVVVGMDGRKFSALDHDFTKCSFTPSVTMFCHIPEDVEESFYRGNVYVGLKDSALEPSSPNRHAAELSKLLLQRQNDRPMLLIYTDGGGDHNVTHLSTQISLINIYLQHDLDMLQAVRTPPYHSWKNPVERVNCILNLGLQSVGLMRTSMDPRYEARMKSCNTVKEIRTLTASDPQFKEAFLDSIAPVKALLSGVFQRLKLKDDPFQVFLAATDTKIEELWNNILTVESTLTRKDTTKKSLSSKKKLQEFLEHCCCVRHYSFAIKKCGQSSCTICKPVRMPVEVFKSIHFLSDPLARGDHYVPFEEVYGVPTTERDRPSLIRKEARGAHGIPFSPNNQTASNVSECVLCCECLRPRVLHSKHKISLGDKNVLKRTLEDILYSCGSSLKEVSPLIQPRDDTTCKSLFERIFVRENLDCQSPVEVPYFSSEAFEDVCVHCACNSTQTELTHPNGAYPICVECMEEGKEKILKRKRSLFKAPESSKRPRCS